MFRQPSRKSIQIGLGLIVAFGIAATRSEKVMAEIWGDLGGTTRAEFQSPQRGHEPFDPARVPQSGGMASRLLAGITVKPV
ncbi:hypothetical protein BH10PSE7_BH10PSE7_40440 [soil metagenome]